MGALHTKWVNAKKQGEKAWKNARINKREVIAEMTETSTYPLDFSLNLGAALDKYEKEKDRTKKAALANTAKGIIGKYANHITNKKSALEGRGCGHIVTDLKKVLKEIENALG